MEAKKIRTAVYRYRAQSYLLVSLISFAGTVILTRLFLEITGYPQLGGGELHIAHVLWGGLILFIAALLPLLFGNRWALDMSAVLSGVGIGLFIDEVGKFITRDNDYFFPPAAPIIYALFLITVLLYLRIRKTRAQDTRQQFYHVLENLTEILDHDLDSDEREGIVNRLEHVISDTDNQNLSGLAGVLLDYIRADSLAVFNPRPSIFGRSRRFFRNIETTYFTRPRMRIGLMIALLLVGIFAWYELAVIIPGLASHGRFIESILLSGVKRGEVRSLVGGIWFFIHLGLQGLVGIFAFASSTLMAVNNEKLAVDIGIACMVLSLTAVNLLAFFVDQFSTAGIAIFQLLVLVELAAYRRRFIANSEPV